MHTSFPDQVNQTNMLELGSDLALHNRWFVPASFAHPARLHLGFLLLVIKDHISEGVRVATADHTIALCETLGCVLHARHQRLVFPLSLWQRRRKERGEPVVEEEDALVFRANPHPVWQGSRAEEKETV